MEMMAATKAGVTSLHPRLCPEPLSEQGPTASDETGGQAAARVVEKQRHLHFLYQVMLVPGALRELIDWMMMASRWIVVTLLTLSMN